MKSLWYIPVFVISIALFIEVGGVDRTNFKSCDQSSFCRRYRAMKKGESPYQLLLNTVKEGESDLQISLMNIKNAIHFTLKLTALENHNFRLQIDEAQPIKERYKVDFALNGEPPTRKLEVTERTAESITVANGPNKAVLHASPFKIDLYSGKRLAISLNAQGLFKFEHYRQKTNIPAPAEGEEAVEAPQPVDDVESDIGAWEENFKSHHDQKPHGPSAVGMDFSFPNADYAYGIPEHADTLALKNTGTTDPYRLYNLDVFEYELNNPMALYGSIPFLIAHGTEGTAGVLWLNAAETWVDIEGGAHKEGNVVSSIVNFVSGSGTPQPPLEARFVSESGVVDAFLFLGPNPQDVSKHYAEITGVTPLPPLFSLGYHQCRWNYNDEDDVKGVDAGFDTHDIPYDVIWLDIEYTEGKKYFTWDRIKFPHPGDMMKNLSLKGHHMVVIIDPHIKREGGYFVHEDATSNGYYVKNKDGNDYEGWCWPGSSGYLDFFNPVVRDYWASKFSLDNFPGTTLDTHIWNDMNEPSVFNGPEITMPKDCVHHGGWEHRDVHNLYGLTHVMSTYDGLLKRSQGKLRPFILTRSFFVGSQRFASVWTGDNMAEWDHLKASIPMCLSISLAGMPFCGADIGGFFKNPDSELFYRWYQAGAFLPFMRGHAHIDTKRREPWVYDQETTLLVRSAVRKRYELLPYWYTLFRQHETGGLPIMRPIWYNYPKEKATFTIEDEFMLGNELLIHPVTQSGATDVSVYFPGEKDLWYDLDALELFSGHGTKTVQVPKEKIPVYQRGGTIIPKKMRVRRSSALTKDDPYTLQVALNADGLATGSLYIDDGESFDYQNGQFTSLNYFYDGTTMVSKLGDKNGNFVTKSWLERIIVMGIKKAPSRIVLKSPSLGEQELESTFSPNKHLLVIRKPAVPITEEWKIFFH
ncbi:neutral alpha-glucosidase AB [Neocloeon triangulifer]|uniref:neutral alpha-glucosidase AB n=1 Tax=Neocloeon triangulifer TaxID=2078957 RepID=UPI00286F97DA|nr:neutral alpha-glucosidase AB [Neocloeon triangulifer]